VDDHKHASDGREAYSDESRPIDGVDVDEQVDVLEHGCGLLESDAVRSGVCRGLCLVPLEVAFDDRRHSGDASMLGRGPRSLRPGQRSIIALGRAGSRATFPARASRRASSSRANWATTSNRPAVAASTRAVASAASTASVGAFSDADKAKTLGGLESSGVVQIAAFSARSTTIEADVAWCSIPRCSTIQCIVEPLQRVCPREATFTPLFIPRGAMRDRTCSTRYALFNMSVAQSPRQQEDSPEVAALRKKARGEPLTEAERTLLATATRKPSPGPTVSHEQIEAMLDERRRRENG
jgi:hypothetical protein